MLELPDGSV